MSMSYSYPFGQLGLHYCAFSVCFPFVREFESDVLGHSRSTTGRLLLCFASSRKWESNVLGE